MFDSHCHLTDARFADDADEVLERARQAGLRGLVTIASNADDTDAARALAERDAMVWCTAGIHPHEAGESERTFDRIVDAVHGPRVVAVGETGLDYYYDNAPRALQRKSFDRHLELGARTGLPVVVHSREADADTIAALENVAGDVMGVLHCFTGGAALFEAGLKAGWYFSFGGMVTFKKFSGASVLQAVPEERLLLETDSPYLAPVPWRGRRNEPAYLASTVEHVARLLGSDPARMADLTERNARIFYGLDANEETG